MDISSLNPKQQEAVTAPMGPVLVLAGPGSGKTKTLTTRIAYIIEQKLIHPANILALTFTNKASKEMRERVNKLLVRMPGAGEHLTMGTFHSVCAKLLRKEIPHLGYNSDFIIFDSQDQQKVLKEILEELRIDTKRLPASMFGALISRAKNLLQMPSELDLGLDSPLREKLEEVYTRYQNSLFKQNALDFDDLIMLTVKLLENFPQVLEKYQKKFLYILVDEYQDTNKSQYTLLSYLAVHKNIFVVGDDAQSIYKFRGSDITNILNFEQDYPEAKIIKLEQNYRSSKNILAIAQTVIDLNSEQKPKKLWTENAEGEKIILTCEADEQAEAEFVARKIVQLASGASSVNSADALTYETDYEQAEVKSYSILDRFIQAKKMQAQYSNAGLGGFIQQLPKVHDPLKEYCVLYRTHAQSRAVEEALIKASIPYQIIGGLKFYERKEIKDMLSYLRLVINFRDLVSLKRVINEPARGIGDKSYEVIRDFVLKHRDEESQKDSDGSDELRLKHYELNLKKFRQALSEIKLAPKQWQATQDFFKLIEELVLVSPDLLLSELMNRIFIRTGYEKYLQDGSEMGEARVENVKELINVTHKYAKMPWREAATEFLQEVALISEIDSKDENKDAVTLMTLHSAKGLEFDNVFFIGLEEGILPHSRSLMDMAEIAEEVRLAYVGLTRARKRLFLVYTHGRRVFGSFQNSTPSRILKVLPKEKLKLKGMAKDHFGEDEAENF